MVFSLFFEARDCSETDIYPGSDRTALTQAGMKQPIAQTQSRALMDNEKPALMGALEYLDTFLLASHTSCCASWTYPMTTIADATDEPQKAWLMAWSTEAESFDNDDGSREPVEDDGKEACANRVPPLIAQDEIHDRNERVLMKVDEARAFTNNVQPSSLPEDAIHCQEVSKDDVVRHHDQNEPFVTTPNDGSAVLDCEDHQQVDMNHQDHTEAVVEIHHRIHDSVVIDRNNAHNHGDVPTIPSQQDCDDEMDVLKADRACASQYEPIDALAQDDDHHKRDDEAISPKNEEEHQHDQTEQVVPKDDEEHQHDQNDQVVPKDEEEHQHQHDQNDQAVPKDEEEHQHQHDQDDQVVPKDDDEYHMGVNEANNTATPENNNNDSLVARQDMENDHDFLELNTDEVPFPRHEEANDSDDSEVAVLKNDDAHQDHDDDAAVRSKEHIREEVTVLPQSFAPHYYDDNEAFLGNKEKQQCHVHGCSLM
jgi:hypothetical protein